MYNIFVSLFCALLLTFVKAQTLEISVYSSSNNYWLAVTVLNGACPTSSIEIQEAGASTWTGLGDVIPGWGYWPYNAPNSNQGGFSFPLSFRLTSENGDIVTLYSAINAFSGVEQIVDSTTQYGDSISQDNITTTPTTEVPITDVSSEGVLPTTPTSPTNAPTDAPTVTPTDAPSVTPTDVPSVTPTDVPSVTPTDAPSVTPTDAPSVTPTDAPTNAATNMPTETPTDAPTSVPTDVPTSVPTAAPTRKPTVPSTNAPTTAPTASPTDAPAKVPIVVESSSAPFTSNECSEKVKVLVPLYVYPGTAWDTVAAGSQFVFTVAIINPNSGPASAPNSDYVTYMNMMNDAGVDMIGYVHTSYGLRAMSAVMADINTYATQYPLLKGIFLDEASADASMLPYYTSLYEYITSMPGWSYDIVNPGVFPDVGYTAASTQIVAFENYGYDVATIPTPSYADCSNRNQFTAIAHTVTDGLMTEIVDNLMSDNYFGYIYATDGVGGCCTYNALSSYYADLVSYIASKQ